MSARDELAELIHDSSFKHTGHAFTVGSARIADDLLTAGYTKPRTVTTAEELDGLAVGSVVLDGDVCVRRDDGYWKVSDLAGVYASQSITFPATILYDPTA